MEDTTYLMPKRGAIALCSLNALGLITCDEPQEITYNDGNKGLAWTGVQLMDVQIPGINGDEGKTFDVKVGEQWSSRNPRVVGYIDDVISLLKLIDQPIPIITISLRDILKHYAVEA